MKNYISKDDTIKESELRKFCYYSIFSRDSTRTTNQTFVDINNGSLGGTQLTWFYIKDNKSFNFVSFGGFPDKFSLQRIPKPFAF